ncbi:MAG: hypothetical protein K0S32_3531 [Bacteroidetes bacterium]|nr:hypothetical protein [Bacteroidota bacterium]
MNRFQQIFINIVNRIESNDAPVKRYIFLFFAILVLRLTLEFFSSHRLFTFFDVMHIGLWFIFIVSAFLLQLYYFSGEDIHKVIKLVITCFTIALTAPIIDIIVSWGQGAKMNYLSVNSWKDVVFAYFTIGGSSLTRGATLGIRIEIVLLVIACFNYVYTKRGSIIKALVASLIIYTVLFLSGTIPFLLGIIVNTFQLQYQHDDKSTLLLLLTLDLILLFFIISARSGTKLKEAAANAPWLFSILPVALFVGGTLLAKQNYPDNWSVNPTTIFWFPLLTAIYFCFTFYVGIIRSKNNSGFSSQNALLFFLLLISALISTNTFFSVSLLWGLLFLLFEAPLKLNKVPVLNSLLKSMALLVCALMGFMTFGAPMIGFPVWCILGILMSSFVVYEGLRLIIKRN